MSAAAVTDAGRGARLIMTTPQTDSTVLTSDVPDISRVPLDEPVTIELFGMARIRRWISVVEDESRSAFNSSI